MNDRGVPSPSECWCDRLCEESELFVWVRADRGEPDRVDARTGYRGQRGEDLFASAGRGELVEEIVRDLSGDGGGVAECPKLGDLRVSLEWGELGGDALVEQDSRHCVSRVVTVGVDPAVEKDGQSVRVGASGGDAALVDALAGPADVGGCGGLCEDRSIRAATGGA